MSKENPTNMSVSIYTKLKNIARQHEYNFMHLLIRYATERFLFRISNSNYAKQLVLKGGNLFVIWLQGSNSRPTIDSDMLCFGEATEDYLKQMFIELAKQNSILQDGITYDVNSITVSPIREETEYGGTRIMLIAYLNSARIKLQFDIGIGDKITPSPIVMDFPVLLAGSEIPRLKTYPMETAIAEKAEVMITHGLLNSRMKDFYDIWLLSEQFEHNYNDLKLAIKNTFEYRNVPIPTEIPLAFTSEFHSNKTKQTQWKAYLRKNPTLSAPQDLAIVTTQIANFLLPCFMPSIVNPSKWIPQKGWCL